MSAPPPISDVHAFAEVSFKNAYITPRGLVVTTDGLTIQPLAGIVLVPLSGKGALDKLSVVAGVWSDLDASQSDGFVGVWNEFDFFAGVSVQIAKRVELGASYLLFTSPPHNFRPEHNLEFKLAFDDAGYLQHFRVSPYVKFFYAIAGDSTVVLGDKGGTYDVEVGTVPSYRAHIARYRVDLTLPTFATIGPRGFFGDRGGLGVFSTGPLASVPISVIPKRLGGWQVDAGLAYFHLFNDNLVRASTLLGNRGRRDEFVGQVRVRMSF